MHHTWPASGTPFKLVFDGRPKVATRLHMQKYKTLTFDRALLTLFYSAYVAQTDPS